jgi:hypothetical protein
MSGSNYAIKWTAYLCAHKGRLFPAVKSSYAMNVFLQVLAEMVLRIGYTVLPITE